MNDYDAIAQRVKGADAILIGAANGLSITEGINLFANDQAMHDLFGDLQKTYGVQNLLQGMMARWSSVEQLWGFWSRMVNHYALGYTATPVMKDLKAIVGDTDHFIVTSNGEGHFQRAGFDPNRIFEVEGDWTHMTCSQHCVDDIVDGSDQIKAMAEAEHDGVVPSDLIPKCPRCGAPMVPTMAAGVIDEHAKQRYRRFLSSAHGKKLVILELGIGARNTLIKVPFMRLAQEEPNATYVTFNLSELYVAPEIKDKSFLVQGYLNDTIKGLKDACAE